jgi:signal transduction histidine kinase/CheY-like chemotaxis protein
MARALESRLVRVLPALGVLTVVYFIAGKFSLKLAFLHASASPVWPAAGIAVAALLLFGYRLWPGIFVGAFLVNAATFGNLATSFSIATGNTLDALCCAWLVNRFANSTQVFDRAQDVFKFALAVVISALISPTFGVTSLALGGFADWANYGSVWLTWWLGDITGALVVAPLIILWSMPSTRRWDRHEVVEVTLLFILLAVLGEAVFGGWFPISARNYPISFVCGPLVIWTAFRFTQRETATALFILSVLAIWGTLRDFGPFVMDTQNHSLLILQTSTAVLTITAMALAAGMAERRRAEEAIEQQKAVIESANRTKDNFLAMLSHELRTPLTPVLAAIDALEIEPSQSADSKAALAMIRRNVELESQLIDDLLDLTRIARDKLELKFDPVDAHEAITNVVEICATEVTARKLRVNLDLRAGAHYVAADATKFQQIIWNLLKNAIKFTGEGGEIAISSANPAPQTMTIVVRDTGIGIDPEIMERMFNPFEQGDRSFQRRSGGLGLGLAISKSLAQAHGGTLEAQSEGPGRGSTFTLTVKTVAPRQRATRFVQSGAESQPRTLRILLVDDHEDTCSALERLLTRRGHLVAPMHDMRSAMDAGARNQFDLLISDIALPDGTGTELMTCLRAITGIRGIAISGFGMNGDIQKSLQAGFSEHLVKPVKLERLEAAINSVMGAETAST